jgi:hypothetical protein
VHAWRLHTGVYVDTHLRRRNAVKALELEPINSTRRAEQIAQLRRQAQDLRRAMQMTFSLGTFATPLTMILAFRFLVSNYDGIVVARLPFEPFGFVTGLSHRNLPGTELCPSLAVEVADDVRCSMCACRS